MNKGSKQKNAVLYATSLYEGAVQCDKLAQTHDDTSKLQKVLDTESKDFALLNNPIWPLEAKEQIVLAIAQKLELASPVTNLLKILVENHKADEISMILDKFKEIYNRKQNIAEAEVETVEALSAEQDKNLKQKLTALFKKDVIVNYHLNPQILGGLVIRCGTVLIDSSVKHRLDSLEQLMKGTK